MKANELIKQSKSISSIYCDIQNIIKLNPDIYKHFIPHWVCVDDSVKLQLIGDGFKVYTGKWCGDEGLIIEW